MTKDETKTILRVIVASYPTFKPENMAETIGIWHMMLEDQDYKLISMALKSYIRTNNSSFAPSIGQLMDYAQKITAPEELTEAQAWSMVMRAVRNSGYNALDEFAKLPENIQKAVGSPEQLRSMALDENFNENVASSNFMRSYKIILAREKELQKIPSDVRALIQSVNEGTPKQLLEQQNTERINRLNEDLMIEERKEEGVPMPEEVRKKLQELLSK